MEYKPSEDSELFYEAYLPTQAVMLLLNFNIFQTLELLEAHFSTFVDLLALVVECRLCLRETRTLPRLAFSQAYFYFFQDFGD